MIIFRHFSKEVFLTLLTTILVLLIILISNVFVHYFNDAAEGRITVTVVMQIMVLQIPLFLGYLMPMGFFLALLLVLGRMTAQNEMVVLLVSGFSRLKLCMMVMSLATLMLLLVAWLILWVDPNIRWYRAKILADAVAQATLAKVTPGDFQSFGRGQKKRTFYAGKKTGHALSDIFIAQPGKQVASSDLLPWNIVLARASIEGVRKSRRFILLKDGMRYSGVPDTLKTDLTQFQEYGIYLSLPKINVDHRIDVLSVKQLWNMSETSKEAAAQLQWRLSVPLSVWMLALVAVALIRVHARHGKVTQILPGIAIYIVYIQLLFMGRSWIESGALNPKVGLWWIHMSIFLFAVIVLFFKSSCKRFLYFRHK